MKITPGNPKMNFEVSYFPITDKSAHFSHSFNLPSKRPFLSPLIHNLDMFRKTEAINQIIEAIPPPMPLYIQNDNICINEKIYTGSSVTLLPYPKFLGQKEPLEEQAKPIKDIPNASFVPDFAPSLKSIFTSMPTSNIVYERVYPDTPRQQDKTSYFLTVLYNVKRLVYLQKNEDEIYEPNKKQEAYVPYYKLIDKNDKTLLFESKFESGNLAIAIKITDIEYDLYMQNDINTFGHTQWFYFRVENTTKGREVKFNIKNFLKKDSLFNNGMKVRIHSHKKALGSDIGWTRGGKNIVYYANGIKKTPKSMKTMYSLSFTYTFEYDNDVVHFAYDKPFTYSEHLEMLNEIEKNPAKSKICTRRKLCRSIARNRVDYITITDREITDNKYKRKGVLLTARMHPGEVVGSWMINGAIEFLTSSDPEADLLRKHLVFKIIPMLNPDGVVNGNYRCSLAGCDLNRQWKNPSKLLHPTVYYSKKLAHSLHAEREMILFCDMHGHSKDKNVFMYGCHDRAFPEKTRIFPYMMSKTCPYFSMKDSKFGNQPSKEKTARLALWREISIPAIYTMEASFCGCDMGTLNGYHFTTKELKQMGRDLCRCLLCMCDSPLLKEVSCSEIKNVDFYKALKQEAETTLHENVDIKEDSESNSGSDDNPSDGNLNEKLIKIVLPVSKKGKGMIISIVLKAKASDFDENPNNAIWNASTHKKEKSLDESPKKFSTLSAALVKKASSVMAKNEEQKTEEKEEKKEESKKEKPIMVDRWTQTESIDFQKARMKARISKLSFCGSIRSDAPNSVMQNRIISTRSESESKALMKSKIYSKRVY